jgi:hypothetical protein
MPTHFRLMLIGRLASGLNGLLGIWIMISPLVSGYVVHHDPDVWPSLVMGGILMMFGMLRLISPEELPILSGINLVVGACILISPWLLRFASDQPRMWTDVALGGLVIVLATLSLKSTLMIREWLLRA